MGTTDAEGLGRDDRPGNAHAQGAHGYVCSVAFSPDGKRIVSGSDDKTLKVWDATSGQEMLTLKGHTGDVMSVAFSPDGKRIVSGSDDKTLKVWDAATGQETLTLKGHTNAVSSVAFSPDGKRIVSGSGDQTVKVWDASSDQAEVEICAAAATCAPRRASWSRPSPTTRSFSVCVRMTGRHWWPAANFMGESPNGRGAC